MIIHVLIHQKMSLHERLIALLAWAGGGDLVDQHVMNMEGELLGWVM